MINFGRCAQPSVRAVLFRRPVTAMNGVGSEGRWMSCPNERLHTVILIQKRDERSAPTVERKSPWGATHEVKSRRRRKSSGRARGRHRFAGRIETRSPCSLRHRFFRPASLAYCQEPAMGSFSEVVPNTEDDFLRGRFSVAPFGMRCTVRYAALRPPRPPQHANTRSRPRKADHEKNIAAFSLTPLLRLILFSGLSRYGVSDGPAAQRGTTRV